MKKLIIIIMFLTAYTEIYAQGECIFEGTLSSTIVAKDKYVDPLSFNVDLSSTTPYEIKS